MRPTDGDDPLFSVLGLAVERGMDGHVSLVSAALHASCTRHATLGMGKRSPRADEKRNSAMDIHVFGAQC